MTSSRAVKIQNLIDAWATGISCASNAHIVSGAYFTDAPEVSLLWHHYPILSLDGFHHEPSYMRVTADFLCVKCV